MAFCTVEWIERPSRLSPIDEFMEKVCGPLHVNWKLRFSQSRVEHRAFAANIDFVDYFYQMYWARTNWSRFNTNLPRTYARLGTNYGLRADPGSEEWDANQALLVFESYFRQVP